MAITTDERADLHRLLDLLPEEDVAAVEKLLRGLLVLRGGWTLEDAPEGEPFSPAEERAYRRAQADIEAGRVISHEEFKKRRGLA